MPRNFNAHMPAATFWRIVLGVLLAANVIAAALVMYPPGGSADQLELERSNLQLQSATRRAQLAETTRSNRVDASVGAVGMKLR